MDSALLPWKLKNGRGKKGGISSRADHHMKGKRTGKEQRMPIGHYGKRGVADYERLNGMGQE